MSRFCDFVAYIVRRSISADPLNSPTVTYSFQPYSVRLAEVKN
jgi:hypothetical protein